jgi:hypothetical protein
VSDARPRARELALTTGAVLSLGLTALLLLPYGQASAHTIAFAFDYRGVLWRPAHAVLHGLSPYDPAAVHVLARTVSPDGPLNPSAFSCYPPLAIVASLPLALLPLPVAVGLFTVAMVACAVAALRLVGVRDWRLLCLSAPWAAHGVALGGLTPLLMLGAAVVWRWRDRPVVAAPALAAAVALKLFLWPLGVFLLATRRGLTAVVAAGLAVAATVAAWAVLGFSGLTAFPQLLTDTAKIDFGHDFSLGTAFHLLGLPPAASQAAAVAVGLGVLAGVIVLGRRGDERRAFILALAASLALSPVVWLHYFLVLTLAIAISTPGPDLIWLAPLLVWGAMFTAVKGAVPPAVLSQVAAALVVALALRRPGIPVGRARRDQSIGPSLDWSSSAT